MTEWNINLKQSRSTNYPMGGGYHVTVQNNSKDKIKQSRGTKYPMGGGYHVTVQDNSKDKIKLSKGTNRISTEDDIRRVLGFEPSQPTPEQLHVKN